MRIITGSEDRASYGPPSIITRRRLPNAPQRRFTLYHEIGHILVQKAGLEDDIRAEVDDDDCDEHLKRVVDAIAAQLVMPDPFLRLSLDRYGFSPAAILELRRMAQVSTAAAKRRLIHANIDAPSTVFVVGETHVLDVASTDPWNQIYRWDRVPDPQAAHPDAQLMQLSHLRPLTLALISTD